MIDWGKVGLLFLATQVAWLSVTLAIQDRKICLLKKKLESERIKSQTPKPVKQYNERMLN